MAPGNSPDTKKLFIHDAPVSHEQAEAGDDVICVTPHTDILSVADYVAKGVHGIVTLIGDNETAAKVLSLLTSRFETGFPSSVLPGMRYAATVHSNPSDEFGRAPFLDNVADINVGDEGFLRLQRTPKVLVPRKQGFIAPELDDFPVDNFASGPGVDFPITPNMINDTPLHFATHTTDAMTFAYFDVNAGTWRYQVLPSGDMAESPARLQLQYGGGFITGVPFLQDEDGVYAFRLGDHVKRALNNANFLDFNGLDEELFIDMFSSHARADRRWIPHRMNRAGNRGYGRLNGGPAGNGPRLAGLKRSMSLMVYPVGPYKPKPMVDLVWAGMKRPVADGTGCYKLSGNYSAAVAILKEYLTQFGGNRYDEIIFGEQDRTQEGLAANIGARFAGQGRGGSDLIVMPTLEHGDVLPSVTAAGIEEMARDHYSLDVRRDNLPLDALCRADELFLMGTAMGIKPIGSLYAPAKRDDNGRIAAEGEVLWGTRDRSQLDTGGPFVRRAADDLSKIMCGTIEDPALRAWMVKVA